MTNQPKVKAGDAMEEANKALQLELKDQAAEIIKEAQSLLVGNSGLEAKVVFYWVAKKYFTDRKTGQPYNPTDWILDVLAYGSLIHRLDLNPMTGDVAVVHFWNDMAKRFEPTYITTIQAMRKIAHRTGQFGGAGAPKITEDKDGNLIKAEATVYIVNKRSGRRMPVKGVAYWAEFAKHGKGAKFWDSMPRHMLSKCALAQAYRSAFSEEFASLYTPAEIDREDEGVIEVPTLQDGKSEKKKKALVNKLKRPVTSVAKSSTKVSTSRIE